MIDVLAVSIAAAVFVDDTLAKALTVAFPPNHPTGPTAAARMAGFHLGPPARLAVIAAQAIAISKTLVPKQGV